MYDGATVSLSVVDVKGDEVLALDAGTVLVIDPYILPFEAQLEEFALGDGDLHLSMLTGHLCLDNIIFCCQIHKHQIQYMAALQDIIIGAIG